jgi:hypothetical protein
MDYAGILAYADLSLDDCAELQSNGGRSRAIEVHITCALRVAVTVQNGPGDQARRG